MQMCSFGVVERGGKDGGQWFASDNALPLSVLPGNHWPSPRKLLSTDSIKSDKSVSVLPGNPLLAVFVPDFDFRPYSGWCGLPYSAALGFLLGLGSSLIRGQHLSPSGAHNYRHQKLSPAPLHCTELEQPFEMRALAKEIKEGLPTPPQSPSPWINLGWISFDLERH